MEKTENKKDIADKIHRINYLAAETEVIYHKAALKLKLSDSSMRVLYTIYDNGEGCLLSRIYKQSGISKQTVNSALRKLEEMGVLYLETYRGNLKKVILTKKGREYVNETAAKLYEAEKAALETWPNEEVNNYIHLMEKYTETLKRQVEKM